MSAQGLGPLSEGTGVAVGTSATDLHAPGAAVVGQIRGSTVHLELVNGTGGAITVTLGIGAVTEDISVATLSKVSMELWVPAGSTLQATGASAGVTAFGWTRTVA